MDREKLGSRLGFILISAGCAIGLGNVWRFPYITGEYGGAAFVLLYLIFLVAFGLPIMAMEFATGRASQKGIAGSFNALEPAGTKWHRYKWFAFAGNILLMAFYTMVAGWMFAYMFKFISGDFVGTNTDLSAQTFGNLLSDPGQLILWMGIVVLLGIVACFLGLRKGVERITKVMMIGLLVLIVILVGRCLSLPNAADGLAFYLAPDFSKLFASAETFFDAAYAALGQSFFTLSIGIGSMAIFGSYIGKEKGLFNESVTIGALDTVVALLAGLIIFPACASFGVDPASGAGLAFITLPQVFEGMALGQLWGTLFFLFMGFAAMSTVIAVFENIFAFGMDQWGWSRKKSALILGAVLFVVAIPAILGNNVWSWSDFPLGAIAGFGSIDGIEDFIVSNNLLPIGSLIFVLFRTTKKGWGWNNFLEEVNTGSGLKFPKWLYGWMKFGVPIVIGVIFVMGWIPTIQGIIGLF
ncbi:MAG: sodium-dependent transporter [Eggerthellaceae bacterium]|nr:sodium-dependent transporter [Eggerthellaceae bacterium]